MPNPLPSHYSHLCLAPTLPLTLLLLPLRAGYGRDEADLYGDIYGSLDTDQQEHGEGQEQQAGVGEGLAADLWAEGTAALGADTGLGTEAGLQPGDGGDGGSGSPMAEGRQAPAAALEEQQQQEEQQQEPQQQAAPVTVDELYGDFGEDPLGGAADIPQVRLGWGWGASASTWFVRGV